MEPLFIDVIGQGKSDSLIKQARDTIDYRLWADEHPEKATVIRKPKGTKVKFEKLGAVAALFADTKVAQFETRPFV